MECDASHILPCLKGHVCRGNKAGRPVLDLSREASQASMPSQDLDDSSPRTSPAQGRQRAALLAAALLCQHAQPSWSIPCLVSLPRCHAHAGKLSSSHLGCEMSTAGRAPERAPTSTLPTQPPLIVQGFLCLPQIWAGPLPHLCHGPGWGATAPRARVPSPPLPPWVGPQLLALQAQLAPSHRGWPLIHAARCPFLAAASHVGCRAHVFDLRLMVTWREQPCLPWRDSIM